MSNPLDNANGLVGVYGTVSTSGGTPPGTNTNVNLAAVAGTAVAVGHGVAAAAIRVELPTDGTGQVGIIDLGAGDYNTVAASQTNQTLGATGATGDYLGSLLIIPTNISPGVVNIADGATANITVFTGGTNSVVTLIAFPAPIGAKSKAGAWKISTGAGVSVIATGNFT